MAGRNPNEGDGKTLSLSIPAGLYEFLTLHAKRAIIGKNQGEVAVFLLTQQAIAYDADNFLSVKLPSQEFPA